MSNKYDWLLKKTPRSVDAMKLWPFNPRLNPEEDYSSITDFSEEITRNDSDRRNFMELIKSIIENGFIPADPIVVWQLDDKKYYVAEGNRRVLALKLLRAPDKAPRSIRVSVRKFSSKANLSDFGNICICRSNF